jgi:hypothetical protein
VAIDVAISKGWLGAVTGAVEELTGHPPASVAEFLAENSDVLFSTTEPALVGTGVLDLRSPSSAVRP